MTRKSVTFKFFQAIIHEFVHSYQDLLCINFLERHAFLEALRDSVLVHDGYNLTTFKSPSVSDRINGDRLYRRNHDLFPGERHADLTSFSFLMPVFEEFFSSRDADLNGFKYFFYKLSSKYYRFGSDYTYPLETFYRIINAVERLESYDFSIYDLHERFIGGMPLSKREFNREKSLILRS